MFHLFGSATVFICIPIVILMDVVSCKITCCGHMLVIMAKLMCQNWLNNLLVSLATLAELFVIVVGMLLIMKQNFSPFITIVRQLYRCMHKLIFNFM